MRRFFFRGAVFLILLALLVPGVTAQSAPEEVLSENLTEVAPETETEPVEEPSEEPVEEPVVLTQVGTFSEGMIRVTDGTRWGYMSPIGTVVIPVQFDEAEDFKFGLARVTAEGKVGLLHWSGSFLFRPEYDELSEVGCGLYLGKRDGVWDLLSTAKVSAQGGATHRLYSGLAAASVTAGVNGQLILREQDGTAVRILLRNLPDWLRSKRVSGWQFPLYSNEKASFADVSGRDWYDLWVDLTYSMGMMEGTGAGRFDPGKELSLAETLRLAACLESRAIQDDFHLQSVSGALWYKSSVTYCEALGIISYGEYANENFNRPVTRAEMARIFSRTSAVRGMTNINDLERVRSAVPDVAAGDYAAEAIYSLYAKGVFTGTDSGYSFRPGNNLTRAEAATVVARIARPEHRITLW